jgi:hypothetical protein
VIDVGSVSAVGRLNWCLALTEATPALQLPEGAVALAAKLDPAGRVAAVNTKVAQLVSPSLAQVPS